MLIKPSIAAVLGFAAACAGCTDGGIASTGAPLGEASAQTFAAQIIDPDPVYDTPVPVSSGAQAQAAIERVRRDAVKKPDKVRTSSVGSLSGGN